MIREARVKDAGRICDLVKQRTVPREGSELGFVEYPEHSAQWYEERINHFTVVEIDNAVEAFVSVYNHDSLNRFENDEIVNWIKQNVEPPFSYFDQLAVDKQFEGCDFGKSLLQYAVVRVNKVVGAVAHAPKRNELPIRMIEKLGFQLQEEIEVYDGLTFGIYVIN
ncbi:MAG: hypothetical protein CMH61_02145 [Nanoarchaeota archaeon]|nr:hypothetical protein [Nanoarchaeota archaeon]|tara:strand:- start:736 stop:1233 length:498 start_codon:yes stop_codon:yes gene_type:complete